MFYNLLEGETNNPLTIIMICVVIVLMVGLLIWQSISGRKKQKEAQDMLQNLKIGDRVKTIGGVCGFVAEINDAENTFVLDTAGSLVKFDKGAIYQTAPAQGNAVQAPKAETKQAEEKPKTQRKPRAKKPATEEKPAE